MGIAAVLASRGAWPVIPFACVEVVALAIAFVVHGRHAGDFERVVLQGSRLLVETVSGERVRRRELQSGWIRVEHGGRRELIRLVAGGEALAIGRFVPDDRREELAREMRSVLGGRWPC